MTPLEQTLIHSALAAQPVRDELMGLEGWRIPAVGVQEQVLTNNVGSMYVPEGVLAESASRWNDVLVTLGHPRKRGQPASGRTPEAANAMGLGRTYNARVEDGQLKFDVFLFDHRLEDLGVGEEIVETVENGDPVEVSTGFGGQFRREPGEFQNEEYDIVAEWVEPDHFAILLDAEGACSVEDGCGLGVNVRSTARTRSALAGSGEVSEGTVPEGWPPNLEDYVSELDLEPADDAEEINGVSDLTEDGRSQIAAHTFLGEASAESFAGLAGGGTFPAVNPETGEIEEGALRAIIGGRGAQADIPDGARESAQGSARSILEEEDLLEGENDDEAENAQNLLQRFVERAQNLLDGEAGRENPAENQEGMSLDDRRDLVSDELDQRFGAQDRFVYVRELFQEEVIYAIDVQGGEDMLFRAPYEIDEEEETVEFGERTEVEEVTEFVPADNEKLEPHTEFRATRVAIDEERTMDRDQVIEALAACEECPYSEDDLQGMEADQLAFVANAAPIDFDSEEEDASGDDPASDPAQNADPATATATEEEPPEWARNLASAMEDLADRVENVEEATEPVREETEQEKRRLASEVAQNSDFEEDELTEKPLAELRKIANAVRTREPVDFSAFGAPTVDQGSGQGEEDLGFETQGVLAGNRGEAAVDEAE